MEEQIVATKEASSKIEGASKVANRVTKDDKIKFKEITVYAAPNHDTLPKEVQDETRTRIGAFALAGEIIAYRSLSEEEIKNFGSNLIGVKANSLDYEDRVNEYFNDFAINIPISAEKDVGGVKIKVPIDGEGKPRLDQKTKKYTLDIMRYRHVTRCPRVADSLSQYEEAPQFYLAYIEDRRVIKLASISGKETRKKADKYYLEITSEENTIKLDWVLELCRRGVFTGDLRDTAAGGYVPSSLRGTLDVQELDEDERELAIEEFKNQRPQAFVDTVEDSNLEWKALLERLVAKGVLIRHGNVIMYDNEAVGSDDAEAIARLKSPAYSKQLVIIKNKLKNKDKEI